MTPYERWRTPTRIDFAAIVGDGDWEAYWALCEKIIGELRLCQDVADKLRERVGAGKC